MNWLVEDGMAAFFSSLDQPYTTALEFRQRYIIRAIEEKRIF